MSTLDKAPTNQPINGLLPASWTRWFNQCYVAVSGALSSIAALQTKVAGLLTAPAISNPTITGGTASGLALANPTISTSGMALTAPVLSGGTIANAALTNGSASNLTLTSPGISGGTIANAAMTNGTASNLTLSTPGITGGTATGLTLAGTVTISTPASIAFGSNWQSWTPTVSCTGSMTATSTTVTDAQSLQIGPETQFKVYLSTTLGGTASSELDITLPGTAAGALSIAYAIVLPNGAAGWSPCVAFVSGSKLLVRLAAGANYTLGSTQFIVAGFYRSS